MSTVELTNNAVLENGKEESDNFLKRARLYRLGRIRQQLSENNCPAILLYDPVNIRYATDSSNMQVWTGRNPARYVMIFAEGPIIAWEFHSCEHVWDKVEPIDELRSPICWSFFGSGSESPRRARLWALEIVDLMRRHAPMDMRIAVDRLDPEGTLCLAKHGVQIMDGQAMIEKARSVKSADELVLIRGSIAACERGIQRMYEEIRPGISEQDLWAYLHFENIRQGGEWIETRLLSSGSCTNPWMQECSGKILKEGELLAFDTDLVGPHGYCADISRTWTVGHTHPTDEQRRLYTTAYEQIHFNMELLRPGMSFREFSEHSWKIPERYLKNRYSCVAHGIGMVDEYPYVAHPVDWLVGGYDGLFESGMTLCMESYIGEEGGREGVKLEQQVLLTEKGCTPLSTFKFETHWL